MKSFIEFLTEDKNTHLEHLEDDIINNGVAGGENALKFLEALRYASKMFPHPMIPTLTGDMILPESLRVNG